MFHVDRYQGIDQNDNKFGWIEIGDGGIFFSWSYDPSAGKYEKIRQIVATMEEDSQSPPTGKWSWAGAERALRSHIRKYGIL